ncbi:FAD-dependent oxidoreductase [Sphingopyxis alaskensis]|uniref:FAD-dependent oxidoreductase n=1 Tax=Sphingopyxis alaskensis TaxID=117207 RepID=UPI00391BA18E
MSIRMVLAGGGHAHLAVLADWIGAPPEGTERWLVTSHRHTAYSGMLPGWIAGAYPAEALTIDLEPLARLAGARLVIADVVGLDPDRRLLELSTGVRLGFDLLSLATGGESDISHLAALGDRLLPVRPVQPFMARWEAFLGGRQGRVATRVAVVGGGAAGVELALAAEQSLRRRLGGKTKVALVAPRDTLLAGHNQAVRRRASDLLRARGIAFHDGHAAGAPDGLMLPDGTALAFDAVIAATGSRPPGWIADTGLAVREGGFVAVGSDLRSASHPDIFAAGDIVSRSDRRVERSGVHAVKAGPVIAANLKAVLAGTATRDYIPRRRTLYLLATGDERAILSWGRLTAGGHLVWRLKDWIDRRFVERYAGFGQFRS